MELVYHHQCQYLLLGSTKWHRKQRALNVIYCTRKGLENGTVVE